MTRSLLSWLRGGSGQRLTRRPGSCRGQPAHPELELLEGRLLLSLNEFPLPTPAAAPLGISPGPDGAIWFTERDAGRIGRLDRDGTMTEFAGLAGGATPEHLTAGPDGNLWFTDPGTNQIGQITPGRAVTEYPVPTPASDPQGITAGPDGAVWFTEHAADRVGRIDRTGQVTEYTAPWLRPRPSGFGAMVAGPDGALWFTEQSVGAIGRVTTDGGFQEFALPCGGEPYALTAGPDGNLWFTERPTRVGRITPHGHITEFSQVFNSFAGGITAGRDGALWLEVNNTIGLPQLGRITPDGAETFVEIAVPIPLGDITTGPDGSLWFTEVAGNQIAQWTLDSAPSSARPLVPLVLAGAGNLSPWGGPGAPAAATALAATAVADEPCAGGMVCADGATLISANHASTSDDDVFGDLCSDPGAHAGSLRVEAVTGLFTIPGSIADGFDDLAGRYPWREPA
jgi:virginiamycin B lyase